MTPPLAPPDGRRSGFLSRHGWRLSLLIFVPWLLSGVIAWDLDSPGWRRLYRGSGYAAALTLAVPYLHFARNLLRGHRPSWFGQTAWLRWHMGTGFVAFFCAWLHSRGRASGRMTGALLVLFWAVMLSAVVGYWGRRLIYRVLGLALRPEFGRARVRTKEWARFRRRARRLLEEDWKLTEYDVENWKDFCQDLVACRWLEDSREGPAKEKGLWDRALEVKGSDGARRALERALGGLDVTPQEMNPVIGVLNALMEKPKCCNQAELKKVADDTAATEAERARRRSLFEQAQQLYAPEQAVEDLKALLNHLVQKEPLSDKQKEDAQRDLEVLAGVCTGPGEASRLASHCDQLKRLSEAPDYGDKSPADLKAETKAVKDFLDVVLKKDAVKFNRYRRNRLFFEMASAQLKERQPVSSRVREFYDTRVRPVLEANTPSWGWPFTPQAREPIPKNEVQLLLDVLDPREARMVTQLLEWVARRRRLDLEEWLDRLANCWLAWHIVAAAALFVLVVDHIVGSLRFGGSWVG